MNGIDTIADWLALCQAKARYCRLIDTKDWAGYTDLVTEDFVLDVTQGTQLPVIHGREAALRQIQSSILNATTVHQVHCPEIEIRGDEAHAVWAMQDRLLWGPGRPAMTGYGHYHERWVRRDGRWKLAAQRLTRLHIDLQPPQSRDPG